MSERFEFYSYRRGGEPYATLDWRADELTAREIEAARVGIKACTDLAASLAREGHTWNNRTGQTEASVFSAPAEVHPERQEVIGGWGVDAFPRVPEHWNTDTDEPLNTKDVAMFLEFGFYNVRDQKYHQYPWLYPVFDATKVMLPDFIKAAYEALSSSNVRARGPGGRFASIKEFLG